MKNIDGALLLLGFDDGSELSLDIYPEQLEVILLALGINEIHEDKYSGYDTDALEMIAEILRDIEENNTEDNIFN